MHRSFFFLTLVSGSDTVVSMLALSQTTGYAILALSCLEGCQDRWVLAKDISNCTGITLPYLSKLLHALTGSRLVHAKRGYRGGFQLTRPARQITLMDVAEAVEGKAWLPNCLLGLEGCSDERACPTHAFWTRERARIEKELRRLTLWDVASFERKRGTRLAGCECESPD
jgi:Rrf2 family transcriptional regulator, iron-sulfur cluster assembly transcription factor